MTEIVAAPAPAAPALAGPAVDGPAVDGPADDGPAPDGPAVAASDLRERAEALLRALAGDTAVLRADQWRAIEALVAQRRRALVVQRTGWGKSAVYFVATALLREAGAGPTLIVSPLLALMRNQVAAAERAGIRARTINSTNLEQWREIETAIAAGEVDVLLVSPERLNNPGFRDTVLPSLRESVGLLVVDEAHCISDWGHDFRPDYRRLREVVAALDPRTPVLATTATANARVTADVAEQLVGSSEAPLVLRGSLDRASLRLAVLVLPSSAHRIAWLAEHLGDLDGSGIIYCLTVAQADDVAGFLRAQGHAASSYSGRTDPADRLTAEDDLLNNRVKALVATSALGMGFDKPDLGFVVHLGAPQSPIAYYQQVGRAGRGVRRADVLLLPGREDEEIWRYFDSVSFPPEQVVRAVLVALADADRPMGTPTLETLVELNRSRLEQLLKVLDVDGAVRRVAGGWVATGQEWTYDQQRYDRVAATRAREQQAMRDYIATGGCRMEFLRRQLDDPGAAPCGRCDRCAGAFLPAPVGDDTVAAARGEIRRPGVALPAKKQWPAAMAAMGVDLRGKLPPDEQCEPGRVIARLSDLGWGPTLRRLLHPDSPDATASRELLGASIEVLRTWGWSQRPVAVVAVGSRRRPELIGSIARGLAEVGRLPYAGTLESAGLARAGGARSNSAHRLREVLGAHTVPDSVRCALAALPDGPVLLVDDLIETGWTMAVCGRLLRQVTGRPVLPFALALAG